MCEFFEIISILVQPNSKTHVDVAPSSPAHAHAHVCTLAPQEIDFSNWRTFCFYYAGIIMESAIMAQNGGLLLGDWSALEARDSTRT